MANRWKDAMSLKKEASELADIVRKAGFEVTVDGSGHYVVKKDGHRLYSFSSTPSAPSWRQNAISDLIRYGVLQPKDKGGKQVEAAVAVTPTTGTNVPASVSPLDVQRAHKERVGWVKSKVEGVIAELDLPDHGGGQTRFAEQMFAVTGNEAPGSIGSAVTVLVELRQRDRASDNMLDAIEATIKSLTPQRIAEVKADAEKHIQEVTESRIAKATKTIKAKKAKVEKPVEVKVEPVEDVDWVTDRFGTIKKKLTDALNDGATMPEIAIRGMREAAKRGLRTSSSTDSLAWSIHRIVTGKGKAESWVLDQIQLGLDPKSAVAEHQAPEPVATAPKPEPQLSFEFSNTAEEAIELAFDLVEKGVDRATAMEVAKQILANG